MMFSEIMPNKNVVVQMDDWEAAMLLNLLEDARKNYNPLMGYETIQTLVLALDNPLSTE